MIIGVHGFGYAPGAKHDDPSKLFTCWEKMLGQPIEGLSYYSYPLGLSWTSAQAYWNSFKRGYWNKYTCAFKEAAPEAANKLSPILADGRTKSLIAHSLGGRVTNLALKQISPFSGLKRVLILEGAELQENILTQLPKGVEVLNICSRSDRVLEDLGAVFNGESVNGCIGRDGLGRKMAGWYDLYLDDKATQARVKKIRGWELDGTPENISLNISADLRDFGGHWRAYCDLDNAPLYKAWLAGESLTDILT